MLKDLRFTAVIFLSFCFFSTPNLWSQWTDLSQTWIHIHLWLLFEKFCLESPGRLPPKKTAFGTDFENFPKISLQRNMISTIGKKLVNRLGLPYTPSKFGELLLTNGRESLASFFPPPEVCAQNKLQADICDTFRFNHIRQMAPTVDADAKSLVSVGEAARRTGSRRALPCI